MDSLNPEHVKAVIKVINQGPYIRYLSMSVREMGKGYAIVEAKIGNEHMHPFGRIHGGAYASILDTAAYWAVYCEVDYDLSGDSKENLILFNVSPGANVYSGAVGIIDGEWKTLINPTCY